MPTNWKLAMEAFMEGYHTMETHPQLLAKPNRQMYRPVGTSMIGPEVIAQATGLDIDKPFDKKAFVQSQLHFMRILNVGMAGMIHDKDVRVAEGLSDIALPDDPLEALGTWNTAVNDAIMDWNQRQGIDMPDLNYIMNNGLLAGVEYCFPHYFLLPYYT